MKLVPGLVLVAVCAAPAARAAQSARSEARLRGEAIARLNGTPAVKELKRVMRARGFGDARSLVVPIGGEQVGLVVGLGGLRRVSWIQERVGSEPPTRRARLAWVKRSNVGALTPARVEAALDDLVKDVERGAAGVLTHPRYATWLPITFPK